MQVNYRQNIAFGQNKTAVSRELSTAVKKQKIPNSHAVNDTINLKKYRKAVGEAIESLANDDEKGFRESLGHLFDMGRKMLKGGSLQKKRGRIINQEVDEMLK